jgi:hypothetical protein
MNGTINIVVSAAGLTIQGAIARTASGGVPPQEKSLPAADAGELTTRTNDTDGTLTMDSGSHGISTGDKIDIFWTASGLQKCAFGATAGTVAGTSVPFTGASGDVLPAASSTITADVQIVLDCDFDGDKLQMLGGVIAAYNGNIVFEDSGNAVLDQTVLYAGEPYLYYTRSGLTNPLTGNPVDEVRVTNASSAGAATFKLCGLVDSDT